MEESKKQVLKVTKEMIRLRMDCDKENIMWEAMSEAQRKEQKMARKPFSCEEGARLFGVTYKKFWRWQEPKEALVPSKKKCPHCGISEYMRVSKWINDGTLNHLLQGAKK